MNDVMMGTEHPVLYGESLVDDDEWIRFLKTQEWARVFDTEKSTVGIQCAASNSVIFFVRFGHETNYVCRPVRMFVVADGAAGTNAILIMADGKC